MSEIGVFFFQFYSSSSKLIAEINVFFLDKLNQKRLKLKKYAYFGHKLKKLASNLKMNITKMEKRCSSPKNL